MSEKKQVGVFWGAEHLCCIECSGTNPTRAFTIPFRHQSPGGTANDYFAQSKDLATLVQEGFQRNHISAPHFNLSLPSKDIIFRSFVIPWMQTSEIKSVVEFEASKYIPFSVNELSYAFHNLSFTDDAVRRIRIIFVAIKKATLEKYSSLFEDSPIYINFMEPAPLSLIRPLLLRDLIPQDHTIALVQKEREAGKIIIVHQGIPLFVREFQLKSVSAEQEKSDPKAPLTRFVNEVRISLDYFNRQDSQLHVKKIIPIVGENASELSTRLEEDLGAEVQSVSCQSILNSNIADEGFLNAFGAAIPGLVDCPANFDLYQKKPDAMRMRAVSPTRSLSIKSIIITLLLCVPIVFLSFMISNIAKDKSKKEAATLNTKLGTYKNSSAEKLKEKNRTLEKKLASYKMISLENDISFFLTAIPESLPEGVWLNDFHITYSDLQLATAGKGKKRRKAKKKSASKTDSKKPTVTINFSGYAYVEDPKEQFQLVNDLQKNLKKDSDFSNHFESIDIETVKTQKLENFTVTFFEIRCN